MKPSLKRAIDLAMLHPCPIPVLRTLPTDDLFKARDVLEQCNNTPRVTNAVAAVKAALGKQE